MHKSRKTLLALGAGVGLRKLLGVGGSIGVSIPREFLDSKGLKKGDMVALVWNGGLRILPVNETNSISTPFNPIKED